MGSLFLPPVEIRSKHGAPEEIPHGESSEKSRAGVGEAPKVGDELRQV